MPIAFGRIAVDALDDGTPGSSDASLGNPYVGVEWQPRGKPYFIEGGAWIPLVSNDLANAGTAVGLMTEFGNRVEAFFPDILPFGAMFNYAPTYESGLMLRLRGGPTVWIPTTDELDAELLASYSGQIGYQNARFVLLSGLTGRVATTADGTFDERSTHFLGGSAGLKLGRRGKYVPTLLVRVPLDENSEVAGLDTVFGVGLSVRLR